LSDGYLAIILDHGAFHTHFSGAKFQPLEGALALKWGACQAYIILINSLSVAELAQSQQDLRSREAKRETWEGAQVRIWMGWRIGREMVMLHVYGEFDAVVRQVVYFVGSDYAFKLLYAYPLNVIKTRHRVPHQTGLFPI
jgi:hypothetical protein